MARAALFSSLVAGAIAIVACSDDGGSGATASTASPFKDCSAELVAGQDAACTDAEMEGFRACVASACDAKYKECFGPDYRAGNYAGACAENVACAQRCECTDILCQQSCATNLGCLACAAGVTACASTCERPTCFFGPTRGCDDLGACCALLEGDDKTRCETYRSFEVEFACTQELAKFKAAVKCADIGEDR